MDIAADSDPAVDGHSTVDHIPAIRPCGRAAFHQSVVGAVLGFPVLPVFITGQVRDSRHSRLVALDFAATSDGATTIDGAIVCDGTIVFDGAVVGKGHTAVHSQCGVFRYGQCFARRDF